jgi:RNA polymerase sigma-70 factor (ECF subfamily)
MAMDAALPALARLKAAGRLVRWPLVAEPDWDAVYAEHLPRVYNFFRYRFGNAADAEDLTARTFEKAWIARHRYRRDIATFATWLMTIARRVALDYGRSRREHVPLDAVAPLAASDTPEDETLRRSDGNRLAALLATLPERDRELLALKYGAGMTNRAIASATGLSESNVGTILHRAVLSLRARWSPGLPPPVGDPASGGI